MKTKDEFEKFCNDTLSKVLEPYYLKNRKKINFSIVLYLILEILLIGGVVYLKSKINLNINSVIVSVIGSVFLLGVVFVGAYKQIKENMCLINKVIIEMMLEFITDSKKTIELKENTMISKDTINECRIFNIKDLKVTGKNYMTFSYKGKNITISDSKIYKLVKKDKKYVRKYIFDGQFISMTFNKPVRSFIYLVPNNVKDLGNKLLNYINYEGTKVELENPLFSKKYKVYSYDEIQARYILSLRLMERMIELDSVLKDKKYIVFRENGRMTLFVENETMDDTRNMKIPVVKNLLKEQKCLLNMFKRLMRYIEIYETLDLGNKLYQPDQMIQQLLADAGKNAKQPKTSVVVSTPAQTPERNVTTGTLSGILENKRFGYKYCYENCVKLNENNTLTLPHDVINSVTFIGPDLERPGVNLIENKINIMVNEFGWEIKEQPVTVMSSGNKFVKVVYKGEGSTSRNMTTYYFNNVENPSYTCGINFKYYENDIEYVSAQVENILSTFILKERFGGYITNTENGFEYQYKNAIEKSDEKIYFADRIYISTYSRVNREKYTVLEFIEARKKEYIEELKWKDVEDLGVYEYGNNKFHKLLIKSEKQKMETFIYANEDVPDVWYLINFRANIDVEISNISDEVEFVLSSFKILSDKKKGTCVSKKYGIKYDYINVNKIEDENEIIFSNNRKMFIKLKNLKTFNNEEECIRNVIFEYTEFYSWVLKSEISQAVYGNNVYKKTSFSSRKNLGYNMDLYFRYIPETNYMIIVAVYYYNDEILELSKETETVFLTLEMLGLKSGKEMIGNTGVSVEYSNAIGSEKGIIYYSTNTRVVLSVFDSERYNDEKAMYENANKSALENGWEIIAEQNILIGEKDAHMFELKKKESKYRMKSYFIKSSNNRQVYNIDVKFYDDEDIQYGQEVLEIINSLKLESGKDGVLSSNKNACGFEYKNAYYNQEKNEISYPGNITFSIIADKIKTEESEEDFINSKIREMTSKHEWILDSSQKETYGTNEYLKYVFKYKDRTLEKYILLPMKNDRNTVFQVNMKYTKDDIKMLSAEKICVLSTFKVYEKINGDYIDSKYKYSYSYINANYLDDTANGNGTLYYPNNVKVNVYCTNKSKYATLEEFMQVKENQWVEDWKFLLASNPEEFAIGENVFVKYRLKSQKSNLSRESYFCKSNNGDYYKYIVIDYLDDDINNYLNELMYILITYKEL